MVIMLALLGSGLLLVAVIVFIRKLGDASVRYNGVELKAQLRSRYSAAAVDCRTASR